MARAVISSQTWRDAQVDFENGMIQADICRKYDIKSGALGNKIKRDGWRLTHEQRAMLSNFRDSSVKVSESFHNATPVQKSEMEIELSTILEDNELVANNRKLAKMAQQLIIKNKDNFNHKNIRNLTGAIKDIESIANTQSSQVTVNTQNISNTQTSIDLTKIEYY